MIGLVVKMVVGLLLFAASLVGGLAVTGRLNPEGVANVPLLSALMPLPPAAAGDGAAASDGTDSGAAPADTNVTGGSETPADAAHAGAPQDPSAPRRQKTGRSLSPGEDPAAAKAEGEGAPAGGERPAGGETAAGSRPERSPPRADSPEADFRRLEDALTGAAQAQYRPGEYFRFQGMPAGLTAEQLNEAWQRVETLMAEIERRKTVLDLREQELQELADDIGRRQGDLGALRVEVEQMQRQLDARIQKFQEQVKLVRHDEVAALKRNAQTLASFEPEKAAELIQEQWKTDQGQTQVLKLLEFMDKDAVTEVLKVLPTPMTQDLLQKRLRVSKEPAAPGRGG